VLGSHPRDKKPVELHSGRYGPYVKHGDTNATLPDRDKVDSVTLADALTLLDEKAAKQGTPAPASTRKARRAPPKTAPEPRAAYAAAAKARKAPAGKQAAAPKVKRAATAAVKTAPKPAPTPAAKARRTAAKK
jgi:topoisomerase IA-like protein